MKAEKYRMIYELKKEDNIIRIIGKEFHKKNNNKGRIIYNNKKINLSEGLFHLINIKNDYLKIQMTLRMDCCNKSCMFKDCSSLIHLKFDNDISNDEFKDISIYDKNIDIDFNNKKEESFDEDKNHFPYTEIEVIPNIKRNLREEYKCDTNISAMNEIFYNCSSLISLPDISNFYTINVIDMNKLFYNCRNLSF